MELNSPEEEGLMMMMTSSVLNEVLKREGDGGREREGPTEERNRLKRIEETIEESISTG